MFSIIFYLACYRSLGTPAVLRYLLDNKMIHGDCLTVTGKTIAENLADVKRKYFFFFKIN